MIRRRQRVSGAWVGIGAVLVVLAAGCGRATQPEVRSAGRVIPPGTGQPYKAHSLSYSVPFPATHSQCQTATAWAREIESRTQGRIKIAIHVGGSLLEPAKTYAGVAQGTADLGMGRFADTRARFPLLDGLDLPLGYPDGKTATTIANAVVGKYATREVEDVHLLYVHAPGPSVLATRRPVAALADTRGLKVGAAGLLGRIVEKLGGTAVSLPDDETCEALRKGDIDAAFGPPAALKGSRLGELTESVTLIPSIGFTTALFVIINKATWEALPADLQQTLSDVSREWASKHGEAWDQADAAGLAAIRELGKQVQTLSVAENERAREAVKAILDEYVKTTEAAGLPGAQVLDDIRQQMKDLATPK